MASRWVHRAGWAALIGVLVVAAIGVGVNVYLNSEYLPRLIHNEQKWVRVDYRLAWSIWPGRLHLEGLKVHGEERTFSWEIQADSATVVADLSALTSRKIDIETLKLKGVSARVRPRLHYLDADADYLAALPPMLNDGSADGSPMFNSGSPSRAQNLLAEGPPLPPEQRKEKDPWSVRIEHARVDDLTELWVDRFRFNGSAEAEGNVTLDAGRVLNAGDTKVEVHDGVVAIEGRTTLRHLEGGGTSALGPVDLTTERGFELLATLSGDTQLSGEVVELAFLPKLPGLPVPIELSGAEGPVKTTVSMKNGAVLPGATLEWEAKNASANIEGFRTHGGMTLHAKVEASDGALWTHAIATFADFEIGREGLPPLSTAKNATLEMFAPNVEMARAARFDQDLRAAFEAKPAKLSAEGVRLAGEERALQWEATADGLSADVDLSKAASHELALVTAQTHGVHVRLRPRVSPAEATAAYLKYQPAIEGFTPAIRPNAPAPPLEERAAANPWGLSAADIAVDDLQELWLENYRFTGHANSRGSFRYEAGGKLAAGPLATQIQDGTLQIAKWKALSKLAGKIEAEWAPFDLEAPEGPGFFHTFSAKADTTAQLEDVNFVRHYPAVPIPAELVGGQGGIRAHAAIKDGVIQAGSEVHWDTRSLQASVHGFRFVGPFTLDARWNDTASGPRMLVEGHVSPYRVTHVGEEKPLVGGKLISWRMEAPTIDLAHPAFEPMTYGQVHDGEVPDLTAVNEFVPENLPLKMEKGSGTFTGKVWFTHKYQAWAEFKVGGVGAQLVYDKVFMKGDWSCEAKLANVNLNTGAGDVTTAEVVVNNMAMREGARLHDPWFGRVELTKGLVRPGEQMLLSGDVDTTMRDGRPLIAFFAAETDLLPTWARSLVTLNALRATGKFKLGKDRLEIEGLNARGQSVEIRGRVRKQGAVQRGDLLLMSRGQEVGVALRGTRVEFKLIGAAQWFRDQMQDPKW